MVHRPAFSRTFWIANTLELFERFAYYGSKAVLAVYIAEQVGLGRKPRQFSRVPSSTHCSTCCRHSPARSSIAKDSSGA
jgi:dipeptide/tripeptide permease